MCNPRNAEYFRGLVQLGGETNDLYIAKLCKKTTQLAMLWPCIEIDVMKPVRKKMTQFEIISYNLI